MRRTLTTATTARTMTTGRALRHGRGQRTRGGWSIWWPDSASPGSGSPTEATATGVSYVLVRGVVVRERRSGKYFGAGTALRQISLATGGTLTL